jgi:anaerobic selenocysteine-containing dehydrogenase
MRCTLLRYARYYAPRIGVSRSAWNDRAMTPLPLTESTKLGVCNLCEAICGLELTIESRPEGDRVTAIRGNAADPLSRGHICPKGVALADIHADPDRLRKPIKKVDGEWVETSWNDALDLVADNLAKAINTHGKDALGIYLGNPNAHSLGSATHGIRLVKAFRTKNRFSASSVDQIPHQFVASLMFGHQLMIPITDIDRTSYFLVFGANPMASNGSLMTVPDFPGRLRELRGRGGRMVVFDPRRTETGSSPANSGSPRTRERKRS